MLRQIKREGDSKADFYLPPVMEKVAKVLADHLSKSNMVHIKAQLAATTLKETIDNDVCNAPLMAAEARLEYLLRKAKSAVTAFVGSVLKAAAKNPVPVTVPPIPKPAPPPTLPGPHNAILAAPPSRSGHYPLQLQHNFSTTSAHALWQGNTACCFRSNKLCSPSHEQAQCKGFARGHCRYGSACRCLHELGMPPPASRPQQDPAQQK